MMSFEALIRYYSEYADIRICSDSTLADYEKKIICLRGMQSEEAQLPKEGFIKFFFQISYFPKHIDKKIDRLQSRLSREVGIYSSIFKNPNERENRQKIEAMKTDPNQLFRCFERGCFENRSQECSLADDHHKLLEELYHALEQYVSENKLTRAQTDQLHALAKENNLHICSLTIGGVSLQLDRLQAIKMSPHLARCVLLDPGETELDFSQMNVDPEVATLFVNFVNSRHKAFLTARELTQKQWEEFSFLIEYFELPVLGNLMDACIEEDQLNQIAAHLAHCPILTSLQWGSREPLSDTERGKPLSDTGLRMIALERREKLTTLVYYRPCRTPKTDFIESISYLTNLQDFTLNSGVEEGTLNEILSKCQNLRRLDLRGCHHLSDRTLDNIQTLIDEGKLSQLECVILATFSMTPRRIDAFKTRNPKISYS